MHYQVLLLAILRPWCFLLMGDQRCASGTNPISAGHTLHMLYWCNVSTQRLHSVTVIKLH